MKKSTILSYIIISLALTLLLSPFVFGQKEISAVLPADGSINVNVGILQWSANEGLLYDLYWGLTPEPPLYKSNLSTMEEKPVIIELNKTYFWKVIEKKDGKAVKTSKVFSFTTLPIKLNPKVIYKPLIDQRDYKIYWTVTINNKEWMAQNLDYDIQDTSFYYDNTNANKVYGKLYLGKTLLNNQKIICPEGWHIPTLQEWTDLLNMFDGIKTAGIKLKDASEQYWRKSERIHNNESGMTILPAGSRDRKPDFSNLGKYTFFWTSTPNPKITNSFYNVNFGFMRDNAILEAGDPEWSYSIRCVKD